GHEAEPQPGGDRRAENEPARLDAGNGRALGYGRAFDEMVDRRGETFAIRDERRDIAELDPRRRQIRDREDQRLDIGRGQSSRRFGFTPAQTCCLASQARMVAKSTNPSTAQPVCLRLISVGSAVHVRNAATSLDIWSTVAGVPSA